MLHSLPHANRELCRRLIERGHEVSILPTGPEGSAGRVTPARLDGSQDITLAAGLKVALVPPDLTLCMLGCDDGTCSNVAPVALPFRRVIDQEIPSEATYNRASQQQSPENVPIGLKAFHPRGKGDKEHGCDER